MKQTKDNMAKLLQVVINNKRGLKEYYEKKGDKDKARRYELEWTTLAFAKQIIKDKDLFDGIADIFMDELKEISVW